MKQQDDQHRYERTFQFSDMFFLRLQPYKQSFMKLKGNQKLAPKFYWPYKVLQNIAQQYLNLNFDVRIRHHPTFRTDVRTTINHQNADNRIFIEPSNIRHKWVGFPTLVMSRNRHYQGRVVDICERNTGGYLTLTRRISDGESTLPGRFVDVCERKTGGYPTLMRRISDRRFIKKIYNR